MRGPQFYLARTDLPAWQPPYVTRRLPSEPPWDGGPVYVQAFSFGEYQRWKRQLADEMRGNRALPPEREVEPDKATMRVMVALSCCRREPGGSQTFVLPPGGMLAAIERAKEALPSQWLDAVAAEAEMLGLRGYVPPEDKSGAGPSHSVVELLADRRFWAALDVLSLKLYGQSLSENNRPIGEVLGVLQRDQDQQAAILKAIGPLAAVAQIGRA